MCDSASGVIQTSLASGESAGRIRKGKSDNDDSGWVVGIYPTMYPLLLLPIIVVIVVMVAATIMVVIVAIDHHCLR